MSKWTVTIERVEIDDAFIEDATDTDCDGMPRGLTLPATEIIIDKIAAQMAQPKSDGTISHPWVKMQVYKSDQKIIFTE